MANHTEHPDYVGHIIPARIYVVIWAILMVGTAITVFAATLELGVFNIVVALLIATIKGTLVVLFFMHLRYSTKLTMVTVIASHLLALHPVFAHHDRLHLARLVHESEPLTRFVLGWRSAAAGRFFCAPCHPVRRAKRRVEILVCARSSRRISGETCFLCGPYPSRFCKVSTIGRGIRV